MLHENYELEHLNDGWGEEFRLQSYLLDQHSEFAKARANHLHEEVEMLAEQNELFRSIKERLGQRLETSVVESVGGDADWHFDAMDKSFQFSRENSTLISSRSRLFDSRVHLQTEAGEREIERRHRRTNSSCGNVLERAIREIEQLCSRYTADLVGLLLSGDQYKASKLKTLEADLSKAQTDLAILRQRYDQQSKQHALLEKRLQSYEAELSNKSKNFAERYKQLTRMQTALVVKERLLTEESKRHASKVDTQLMQVQLLRTKEQKLSEYRNDLDRIWEEVVDRVDSQSPQGESFKTQIYARCKDSLMRQRKLLSEEQYAMERYHDCINRIVSQLKEHRALN